MKLKMCFHRIVSLGVYFKVSLTVLLKGTKNLQLYLPLGLASYN